MIVQVNDHLMRQYRADSLGLEITRILITVLQAIPILSPCFLCHPYIPHTKWKNFYCLLLFSSTILSTNNLGASIQQCYKQQNVVWRRLVYLWHGLCLMFIGYQGFIFLPRFMFVSAAVSEIRESNQNKEKKNLKIAIFNSVTFPSI